MIRENLLYLNKDIRDRETVITYIADMADTVGLLSDKNLFLKSVQEREHILPTSVGFKVAIPLSLIHIWSAVVVERMVIVSDNPVAPVAPVRPVFPVAPVAPVAPASPARCV